jgi:hypothetical protein
MTLTINSTSCPVHQIWYDPIIDGGCPFCRAEWNDAPYSWTDRRTHSLERWTQDYLSYLTRLKY